MKELLEERYNIYYKEYKEYNDKAIEIANKVKVDREKFSEFANKNKDNVDKLLDELFTLNEKQILHLSDLASLKARLKIATDFAKDVIDIPEEILKEVNSFPNLEFLYKPSGEDMIPLDEDKINIVKNQWKTMYKNQVENMVSNFK